VIDEAKIAGLRQGLARGPVQFKNGAIVWRDEDCRADLIVTRTDGTERRVNEFAHDQLAQAYTLAITPAEPPVPPQPKIKPTRSRTDFGDCPF
jgi:hypothetical protein